MIAVLVYLVFAAMLAVIVGQAMAMHHHVHSFDITRSDEGWVATYCCQLEDREVAEAVMELVWQLDRGSGY